MRRDIRSVRIKGVHRVKKGGKVYKYHRATGTPLPSDIPETDDEFLAEFRLAESGAVPKRIASKPGSLGAACEAILNDDGFKSLSSDYHRSMQTHINAIRATYGDAPASMLATKHIEADLAKLLPHPANNRLKAWRLLCKFMKKDGRAAKDVSKGISKRKTPKSDGHLPWDADQIQAYRAHWPVGTIQRAAMELLHWTGARTRDAVRLTTGMVDSSGLLTYRQTKTSNPAHVPWTCALPDWANWEIERDNLFAALDICKGFTFLETPRGQARSHKGLSNLIGKSARAAGIEGRTAHGFRKTRLMAIAESGGTAHAIMSWGGHVTLEEAQDYCRKADLRRVVMGNSVNHSRAVSKNGKFM